MVIGHRTVWGEAKSIASLLLFRVNGGSDLSPPSHLQKEKKEIQVVAV